MSYLYGVKCVDEDKWVYTEGKTEPTLCPNNINHTVDRVVVVKQLNVPIIVDDPIQGFYLCQSLMFDVPVGTPGDVITFNHSWNIDCIIWTLDIIVTNDMIGDIFNIFITKDTTVGVATSPISPGTTVIPVNSTVTENVYEGFYITMTDTNQSPPKVEYLGECIGVDKLQGTITVTNPTSVTMNPGSIITIDVYMIKDYHLSYPGIRNFSSKGLKGKPYLANTVTVIQYTNNNGAAKTLQSDIERFYGV